MAVRDINQSRQWAIIGVFIAAAFVLLFRAMQLQIFSPVYRSRADAITIEGKILYPSRGVIYDRHGKLIVYNNALYDLMVTYKQVDPKIDTSKFCRLLGIDDSMYVINLNKDWKSGQFNKNRPYIFQSMITPEQFARFQESLHEFPGFFVQVRNVRGYPQNNAGQVLGYMSEVNEKQLKDSANANIYEPGDYIGMTGLERYYETILRGQKGVEFIMKDNLGRRVGAWKEGKLDSAAVEGKDLLCGIDLKLQVLGEKLLQHKIGSIVAIEPQTGEILAMVTSPTFAPQDMVISKKRGQFIADMYRDSLKPLFDRSVSAKYPPGSVFKPMIGAIALQMGVWNKNDGVYCGGGYRYNDLFISCHGPSPSNITEAVEHSCNAYFCTLYRAMVDRYGFRSARTGLDTLNQYLNNFGMGKKLEVDFPGEKAGLVPSPTLYDKIYRKEKVWYSTNFVSNGIGQGENQLTTLQMANLAAILANRGWYITPHLIKGTKDSATVNGFKPIYDRYVQRHSTGVAAEHFDPIIAGMIRVIEGNGTGGNAYLAGITIAGKTGTSQNPHGDDSSVFIGFAPAQDPKIAIAVYIENGGWGNDFAAPMTSLMIEQYLTGQVAPKREWLVEKMNRSRLAYARGKGYYVAKAQ